MAQPARLDLERLLLSLFSADELRRFLHYLPDAGTVVDQLPGPNAPRALVAEEAVRVLERHGLLDASFFAALRQERPRRAPDIDAVARTFLGATRGAVEKASGGRDVVVVFAPDGALALLDLQLDKALTGVSVLPVPVAEWQESYLAAPTVLVGVLCTPGLFSPEPDALRDLRRATIPVVPILVAGSSWRTSALGRRPPLPSNGVPTPSWNDPREARANIVSGLSRLLSVPAPAAPAIVTPAATSRPLTDIFRTTGVPDLSFVAPAQLPELVTRLKVKGEGLVVDGPSGIGKTTAVRKALQSVALTARWLSGTSEPDVDALEGVLRAGPAAWSGILVVDDFHRLAQANQRRVASFLKAVADNGGPGKVVVIGVNPVGTSLVQDFPDVAGRFRVVAMRSQPDAKIADLVDRGGQAANLVFDARDDLVRAAAGSFYTAQMLCLEAAALDGVREVPESPRRIASGPYGGVADRVREQLRFKYQDAIRTFASWCPSPPPQGATLALLWMMSSGPDGTVSLAEARTRFPALAAPLDWLMASNLQALFTKEPRLGQLFFYNRDAAVLSAEDPQLEFYLRTLSWPGLARDSGHSLEWTAEGAPQFGPAPAAAPAKVVRRRLELPPTRLLHLSDLHFADREAALVAYDQLWADLRTEQKEDRLDVVVVSGDLSTKAEPAEFVLVEGFLRSLREDFKLDPSQFVLVPGNHDLSWDWSKQAYGPGNVVDESVLRRRFEAFADLYFRVRLEPYPLDYEAQATVHRFPDRKLVLVGLNSAWKIDHQNLDRADINAVALGRAVRAVQSLPDEDVLRIAVWHHPIQSGEDSRIRDTGFLERLAQAGFRLGLHGHMHQAQEALYRYDMTAAGRRLDLCGAGTFGAPTREWVPGYPKQYQVIELAGDKAKVRTRRMENPNGSWKPDARWTSGPRGSLRDHYTIDL